MDIQCIPMTPFVTNCYVLREGGEAIVVDAGDVTDELLEAIEGHRVTAIVNTHCHIDHCGGNAELVRQTGAPLMLPEGELPLLHAMGQQGMMFGTTVEQSPDPDRYIQDGDQLTVGETTLDVIGAPGHSPDHVVLLGDGFVIGGDVLFMGSIGRVDLPGGSGPVLLESIRTKLLTLPDETVVYSGHGPETTIGAERATNPFLAGL